jgi:hypothetical protein
MIKYLMYYYFIYLHLLIISHNKLKFIKFIHLITIK